MHLREGAIKQYAAKNNQEINRNKIVNNIEILYKCNNKRELEIAAAILILDLKPEINIQCKRMGGTLKLYGTFKSKKI